VRSTAVYWLTYFAERRAAHTSVGIENVVRFRPPMKGGPLPNADIWPVFQGPFAWTLLPAAPRQTGGASMQPDVSALRVIANVAAFARPDYAIDLVGIETVDDHSTYHLRLRPLTDPAKHNLRDLWVDVTTYDLWKAHYIGTYGGYGLYASDGLSQSDVTAYFKPVLKYWIVSHMVWTYDYKGHIDYDTSTVEIAFPSALPDWLFDADAYAQHQKAKEPDILYQVLRSVASSPSPLGAP
jgi:hypothetical protein